MNKSIYIRPNKPRNITISTRKVLEKKVVFSLPEPVAIDSITECHVTPPAEAARMVEYLNASNQPILEPQGGTGNIVKAIFNAGYPAKNLTVIERHNTLCNQIFIRFRESEPFELVNKCFLEYAQENKEGNGFPYIIMNPPFRHVKKHMNAALSLLKRKDHAKPAVLVALVPVTYQHEEAESMENLPNNIFSTAKVNTKIIRIKR